MVLENLNIFFLKIFQVWHDIPKGGFSTCDDQNNQLATNIFEQIDTQAKNIHLNGRNTIKEFFHGLKTQVDHETELAMEAIKQSNKFLQNEINTYEKQKEKEFDDLFFQWFNTIAVNRQECEKLRNSDVQLIKAVEFDEQFKASFDIAAISNQIFKGLLLKFQKNPILLDSNIVGSLKLQKLKTIDFKSLKRSSLFHVINDLDQSALNSVRVEYIDNGDIFIIHKMINGYYKVCLFTRLYIIRLFIRTL